MREYIVVAIVAVNVLTFFLFGLDKWRARKGRWRVPEAHLLLLAAATGAVGAWCAVSTFRNKSRKVSFQLKLVLATAVNGLWIWLLLR
jgi:uncharacterized membrane protein YsdA (DUF1294 family)